MKARITWFCLLILCLMNQRCFSQAVGINNSSPDASSILDVTSTNKGMLVPRLTETQMNAVASPANGLLVYNTTKNKFYYYDSNKSKWVPISNKQPTDITFISGNVTLTLSLGTSEMLATTQGTRLEYDFTNADSIRFITTINNTLVLGSAVFKIQYSTNSGGSWSDIGLSNTYTNGSAGYVNSGWIVVPSLAQKDILLRVVSAISGLSISMTMGSFHMQAK